MTTKADYVRAQPQTRAHTCHWPGCGAQVPPAMWGCRTHWYRLPSRLRAAIWATYRPGQEITMTPSPAYLQADENAQRWIRENEHGQRTVIADAAGSDPGTIARGAGKEDQGRGQAKTNLPDDVRDAAAEMRLAQFVIERQAGSDLCADCQTAARKAPATYALIDTDTGEIARLCVSHAAAAAHRYGIRHAAFNPNGATA